MGPRPSQPDRDVVHWYEMRDAVQAETYSIDGVEVSSFVLPLHFTGDDEAGGRNDSLGRRTKGRAQNTRRAIRCQRFHAGGTAARHRAARR